MPYVFRLAWLVVPALALTLAGGWLSGAQAQAQETAPDARDAAGVGDADAPTQAPKLLEPPEGFDDSDFRIDAWGGWRILNVDGTEPDAFALGFGSYFRFSRWKVRVGFELGVREGKLAFRSDDINEVSDWFHILRQVQYAEKGEQRFFFRLGELHGPAGTIGHGTIVDHYHSVTDYNSPHIGMQIDLDFESFGIETLVNSFTGWNTAAARGYMRPLRLAGDRHPVLKDLELAVTIAGDVNTPDSLTMSGGSVALDGKRNIRFEGRSIGIIGADIDVPLVLTEDLELNAWADFAQIIDYGNGWFVGADAVLHVPLWSLRPVRLRVEGHLLTQGFLPNYFDAFYEVERYAFPSPAAATTKVNYLPLAESTFGVRASLEWGIEKLFVFRATFAEYFTDRDNELGRLMLEIGTAPDARLPVFVSASWIKRGVSSFEDAFALDERAMLRVNAWWRLSDEVPLQIGLTVQRVWAIDVATGRYQSLDAWFPWLGLSMGF